MTQKTNIEDFLSLISSDINNSTKTCNEQNHSFVIKNVKLVIPCILEYEQGNNHISVSCLDRNLIQSQGYDPSSIARIEVGGDNFLGIEEINSDKQ